MLCSFQFGLDWNVRERQRDRDYDNFSFDLAMFVEICLLFISRFWEWEWKSWKKRIFFWHGEYIFVLNVHSRWNDHLWRGTQPYLKFEQNSDLDFSDSHRMQTQFSPKTRQYDDDDSNDYIDIKQNWFKDQKDRFANREKRPKRELDQDRMDATFTNFSNVILPKKRSTEVPSKRSNGVLAFRF